MQNWGASHEALQWLEDRLSLRTVMLSDSLSALQALEAEGGVPLVQELKHQLYLYQRLGFYVSCVWIPSYVGIHGNEVVDRLAKDALQSERVNFTVVPGFRDISCGGRGVFY